MALAHSEDMAESDFFGHVSPTNGTLEDRMKRAHLTLAHFGENVALSDSAETAHAQLMDSPGHRGGMLDGKFTHVGIGVAVRSQGTRKPRVYATLIFGKRSGITLETVPARVLSIPHILHRGRRHDQSWGWF